MMLSRLLLIFLFLRIPSTYGSTVENKTVVKGSFQNCKNKPSKIWINSFYGTTLIPMDTVNVKKNGTFEFSLILPKNTGYYRISTSKTNYVDIILTSNESPNFTFESCELQKWIKVAGSHENNILLESKRISSDLKGKPELFKELEKLSNKNKSSFFSKTTLAYLPIINLLPDTFAVNSEKIIYATDHYFDNVDFNDNSLINSTVLPNIYMRYFEQFTNYDEEGFKKSIDLILTKCQDNELIYGFTLDFLINLFKKTGPEIILEYLIENYYLKFSCGNIENIGIETKNIIASYSIMSIGNQIPDFTFQQVNSETDSVSFSKIFKRNKLTALIFWSSYCHYCALKSLEWNKIYELYSTLGLEFIYISLDTDRNSLQVGIEEKKLKGIHTCDLKGWEGKIVKKLNINRTPYIYLLSKDGKILLKDPSLDEFKTFIANYLH